LTVLDGVRSLLFAPGDDEHKLRKALASEADGVIADLEDAVDADRKDAARTCVQAVFGGPSRRLRLVRIAERQDVDVAERVGADAIVVPKATVDSIRAFGVDLPPVIALVETAAGVRDAYAIAAAPSVEALMFGSLDLAVELGVDPAESSALLLARSQLVLASAAAGIRPPFDGVQPNVRDTTALEREVAAARALGFGGKACIHPGQLAAVAGGFAPSTEEVEWARTIVAAWQTGDGVASVDGRMVDRPVVLRARRILELAEGSG
jgi:citrate lyase beta subunit